MKKILFVGSFKSRAKDGSVGGQMFACRTLISSSLSNKVNWILLDTTGNSVPPPILLKRLLNAVLRIIKHIFLLTFKRPNSVLVFSASGASVYEKGLMIMLSKLYRCKTIFAPRGGALIEELADSRFMSSYFNVIVNNSDYIVCQGTYWKNYFQSIVQKKNQEKLILISNWIDWEKYYNENYDLTAKKDLSINILFMGWMQPEKGVIDLFNALRKIEINSQIINVHFLGDGILKNELSLKAASGDDLCPNINFYFPGWVYGDEKLKYLKEADIFVLPSYIEGMPNSLMEAMASNTACISTAVGSVSDLIEDGFNGFLFNPGDVKALTSSLKILIENDEMRKLFADRSSLKIKNNFSVENAVKKFELIF